MLPCLLWGLYLALIGCLVWALPRGFDITDEGFSALGHAYPSETVSSLTYASLIVGRLLGWLPPHLIIYRLFQLLFLVTSGQLLAWGMKSWIQNRVRCQKQTCCRASVMLPYVGVGTLFSYTFYGKTLTYNSLNACLLYASAGLLILVQANRPRTRALQTMCLIGAGTLLGTDLFVKFSTSLAVITLSTLFILVTTDGKQHRLALARVLVLGFGYLAGLVGFFAICLPPAEYVSYTRRATRVIAGSSHNPHQLMSSYLADLRDLGLKLALQDCCVALVVLLAVLIARRMAGRRARSSWALLQIRAISCSWGAATIVCSAELLLPSVHQTVASAGVVSTYGYASVVAVLALPILVPLGNRWPANTRPGLQGGALAAFLLTMPFAGALGSSNPITLAASNHLGFWFAAIALLAEFGVQRTLPISAAQCLVVATSLLAFGQLVQGVIVAPYRIAEPLVWEDIPVRNSDVLSGIMVDSATSRFFARLHQLVNTDRQFSAGTPVIAAYDMPGIVYMLGGVSPGTPWYFSDSDQQTRDCDGLKSTRIPHLDRAIVITDRPLSPTLSVCLVRHGISFPDGYLQVGTVTSPYSGRTVRVYLPRGVQTADRHETRS